MPKATDTMKTGLALPADAGQAWDATDAPKPAQNGTERARPDPEVMRERHWRDALRRRMLAFADTLSVLAAALLMELALTANDPLLEWCLLSLPLWVVLAKLHGLYDKDHRVLLHTTADDLAAAGGLEHDGHRRACAGARPLGDPLTPGQALGFAVALLVIVACARVTARAIWRQVTPAERVMIIGDAPQAEAVRRKLALLGEADVTLVGFVDEHELARSDPLSAVIAAVREAGSAAWTG